MADSERKIVDLDEAFEDVTITEVREKVEYFRKKGTIIKDQILKDENGDKKLVLGNGKRGRGCLKGVMVAYTLDDDDIVRIGFSMCHPTDRWDHIKGIHHPGWGKHIAEERGEKWLSKTEAMMHKTVREAVEMHGSIDVGIQAQLHQCVIVPDSMYDSLCTFVQRCKRYYKDKRFPVWVDKL